MEEPEFSYAILSKLNLDDIEEVVKEAYHKEGSPGRPPRKTLGPRPKWVQNPLKLEYFILQL